ncbi:hypothetical protein [Actinomadura sp. K4S16]|uniref:hypothetical protein n=1 Tax=Actinomadura sp. K4S16 TaxID=1316147 RepID=UPI0011EE1DE9|nr:hypothetical protein [Actinomadura sp. K4S16]
MDSLTAAGWKFPGRPGAADESSTAPTGDKQQTLGDSSIEAKPVAKKNPIADETDEADVGSQVTNEPDDTTGPAENGNGCLEAEKRGQAKSEDPAQDEDERADDNPELTAGQPETSGAGGQDDDHREPYPGDGGSSADDKTDDPEPPRQQESLLPDNAAPPKQPSRLESLARAREAQIQVAEQLRAKFQDVQTVDGDKGAPPQSENTGDDDREPEERTPVTEASPGDTDGDDGGEPPAEPAADSPRPTEDPAPGEENKPQPGPEVAQSTEETAPASEGPEENAAPPEALGDQGVDSGKDAVGDGTVEDAAGETTEFQSAVGEELADGEAEAGRPTSLEGQRDYVVDDPAVPGRTITDIDRIQDGVLWEEKSATNAGDIGRWVAKHIDKKFSSYLDARQYMVGYEQAPIGFYFTTPDADPAFRSEVESAVERLRLAYPSEQILLEWS